jgi:hypothetical protein
MGTAPSMRFDSAKALETFRELGDPRFSGPNGEEHVADLVAERFEKMGLTVERREAVGSRLPQRVGPWVGWLSYGSLLTAAYLLLLQTSVLTSLLAFVLLYLSFRWLDAIVGGRIHPGRRRPPLETAPVVIASTPDATPAPVRVVFQVVLGGMKSDLFHLRQWSDWDYFFLRNVTLLLFFALLGCKIGLFFEPTRAKCLVAYGNLMQCVYPGLLAIVWLQIASLLSRESGRTRGMEGLHRVDRRGLAVILEMARAWPRTGSRPIEPVFVAAGGQRLDHAGSREIVRLLGSEWSSKPSLLQLFFAPGAGEKLDLTTFVSRDSDIHELAHGAAQSLWIPIRANEPRTSFAPWPFTDCRPAVALSGSEPNALTRDSADPQALHRAAQLAAEIALRWAKAQKLPPNSQT